MPTNADGCRRMPKITLGVKWSQIQMLSAHCPRYQPKWPRRPLRGPFSSQVVRAVVAVPTRSAAAQGSG
jgi:hypothetical protein